TALDARSNRIANASIASGIRAGDRVAVSTRNPDSWYPSFFGVAKARACLVPVNCRSATAEIAFISDDAAPRISFVGEDFCDAARAAIGDSENPPTVVALYGAGAGSVASEEWLGAATDSRPGDAPQLDDDVLQLYTSGTTGRPKGVVSANRNYRSFSEMAAEV
ncbi:hypothetical protein OY671_011316, partial [Metschnikowia pulcherrima]